MNESKTLETQAPSNKVAISTPSDIDYNERVKVNAKRKADNGAQFSSTKGKVSLLLCVVDDVRSLLGIAKFDEQNKPNKLPDDIFNKCKESVESFWRNQAVQIANTAIANDAKVTTRHGILMTRIGKGDKLVRSKTDKMVSVYNPQPTEYKLCDTFGLTAAQARMDFMLDNVGKFSREELKAQQHAVELLQSALASHK
jgi:hypothetical protein